MALTPRQSLLPPANTVVNEETATRTSLVPSFRHGAFSTVVVQETAPTAAAAPTAQSAAIFIGL